MGEHFVLDHAQISRAEELISKQIANQLRMRLAEDELRRVQKQNPQNAEAYRYYLRGRCQWGKRTEAGLRKAIEHFKEAIYKVAVAHSWLRRREAGKFHRS